MQGEQERTSSTYMCMSWVVPQAAGGRFRNVSFMALANNRWE